MLDVVILMVGLVTSLISMKVYKNKKKVNKGFALSYYKLSSRRKFIRNLWTLPLFLEAFIAVMILTDMVNIFTLLFLAIILLAAIIQCVLLYRKWKLDAYRFSYR